MHDVFLAEPAAVEFSRLKPVIRSNALRVMREIRLHPASLRPIRVYSSLLDTTLFLVRKAGLRLLFEMADGRAVILAIESPGSRD